MIGYLFDTDTCIYLINGHEHAQHILRRMDRLEASTQIGLSAITVGELRFGVAKSRQRQFNAAALERFLLDFTVLPFDDAAARTYGPARVALESRGRQIGPLDTLIAAHALAVGAVMVTNNAREFSRVPGLVCENWAVP
ncbi:MAG TPA: type II toxin-antitoxin system VapC family toxin [Burkholderiales bacterium]